jgi:hypothetical protein
MPPSDMLRRVALVTTDVSEKNNYYIMRVTRIGEKGTTLAVPNFCHLDDGGYMFLRNSSLYKSHTT